MTNVALSAGVLSAILAEGLYMFIKGVGREPV